jgi:hypothetical protein
MVMDDLDCPNGARNKLAIEHFTELSGFPKVKAV